MKGYIISIAGAAVLSAIVNMLSPDKWNKYIGIVTGLIITVSIGRPIFSLMHTDVFSGFSLEASETASEGSRIFYGEIKNELERRIENDIRSRIRSEFGTECTAEAESDTDDSGRISGIRRITVYGARLDNAAVGRLREVYGAAEVVIGGDQKLSQKAE